MASEQPIEPQQKQQIVTSDENVSVSVEPHGGAIYHALHVSRTVKTYPIQEHELLALDDLGRNSTLWTAIGAATLALVASCVWSMLQNSDKVTPGAEGFAALLFFVSVASFLIGCSYGKRRKSRLEKIMTECNGSVQ